MLIHWDGISRHYHYQSTTWYRGGFCQGPTPARTQCFMHSCAVALCGDFADYSHVCRVWHVKFQTECRQGCVEERYKALHKLMSPFFPTFSFLSVTTKYSHPHSIISILNNLYRPCFAWYCSFKPLLCCLSGHTCVTQAYCKINNWSATCQKA